MQKSILLLISFIFLASCSQSSTKPRNAADRVAISTDMQLPEGMMLVAKMPEPFFPESYDDQRSFEKNFFNFRNGIAYFYNNKNELVCFDVMFNMIRWKAKNRLPVNIAIDHASQENILIETRDNNDMYHFLEPETGKQRFILDYNPSRIIYADKQRIIYQDNSRGEINCISSLNGSGLWKFKTPGYDQAPGVSDSFVASHGNKAIIAEWHGYKEPGVESRNVYLFEFDINKGEIIREFSDNSENYDRRISYIQLEDDTKIIIYEKLDEKNYATYLYDLKTGKKVWSMQNMYLKSLHQYGSYLIVESDGNLSKLNIDNGVFEWSYKYVGMNPSIISCDGSTVSFESLDDPEAIPQEGYAPYTIYHKKYALELDFKTGVQLNKYISYSSTKSSEKLRNVIESYKKDTITVEIYININVDEYGNGAIIGEEILKITDNESKSAIEKKLTDIREIWFADNKTVIALTKEEIFAYKAGKQVWVVKRTKQSHYPQLNLTKKGNVMLYESWNEDSISYILLIDIKTGEIISSLECYESPTLLDNNENNLNTKPDYCFNRDKDWLRIFKLPKLH